jgi:hypothetical protein
VLGALALAGTAWAGCGGKAATEYVAGFSTQVQVPRDLQSIIIRVDVNGNNAFEHDYPVYNGQVRLPQTLGVINESTPEGTPITISVYGFSVPDQAPGYQAFQTGAAQAPTVGGLEVGCKAGDTVCAGQNGGGARLLRASRQPYVDGQVIYLPMPIHYSCYDVDCGPNGSGTSQACQAEAANNSACSCVAGQCVVPDNPAVTAVGNVVQTTLPPYNDALIYGSTNTCFRPFSDSACPPGDTQCGCMDYEIGPQVVGDPTDCVFSLPTCTSGGACSTPGAGPYVNPDFPPPLPILASEGGGLNVRAVFDNLVSEVLDYEGPCPTANGVETWPPTGAQAPIEGYCTYPSAPQKFRLAPGLCQQYLGQSTSHQITLLEASATCPSKTEFQPLCDDTVQGPPQPTLLDGGSSADGVCNATNALQPAPSALYILFDRSTGTQDFFGSTGLGEVLGLSLTNPVFQQTQVGMMYTPAKAADCTTSSNEFALDIQPDAGAAAPEGTVPFEFSSLAQGDIANSIDNQEDAGAFSPGSSPWYLEAALAGAYSGLQNISGASEFNRRAVMIFYDRDFNVSPTTDCPNHVDAITEAKNAFQQEGIETYAVYLANADFPDGGVPGQAIAHGQQLAQGFTAGGQYFFNASSQAPGAAAASAGLALASVVADLGSCVYEIPLHFVPGVNLNFPDYAPLLSNASAVTVSVSYADSCALDNATTNPLYVFDNQHIRICQNTCQRLVTSITDDEIVTEKLNQGRATPLPTRPVNVGWGYACGSPIPDASIVESGSAPTSTSEDAGVDAGSEDAGAGDDGGGPG